MRTKDLCNYSPVVDDTSKVNEGSIAPMLTTNTWVHIYIYIYTHTHTHIFFVQWTNKCTFNWQIIILLLHVSTLLCHLQGARS